MRSDILASDTCLIFFYNNWTRALAMAAVAVGPQQALSSHGTRRHAWSVRLMGRRAPVRSLPPALAAPDGAVVSAGRARRAAAGTARWSSRMSRPECMQVTYGGGHWPAGRRVLGSAACAFLFGLINSMHACKLMSTRRGRVS